MEIADIRRELGLENIDLEDIDRIKFQLQQINDTIEGGIRSANLKEYRNTYVINAQDSLDATYPMYVHFNIISEMTRIVSIKLSFWFLNFRAYSTVAKSGGAVSSESGGEDTLTSSGFTSLYGGKTGQAVIDGKTVWTYDEDGPWFVLSRTSIGYIVGHTHTVTITAHTHMGGLHAHDITYGIHEEETSPTIVPSISRDNGLTYSLPIGSYTKDQKLDITRFIETAGSKIIKFTSTTRARLSVQIEIKLDIKARS